MIFQGGPDPLPPPPLDPHMASTVALAALFSMAANVVVFVSLFAVAPIECLCVVLDLRKRDLVDFTLIVFLLSCGYQAPRL